MFVQVPDSIFWWSHCSSILAVMLLLCITTLVLELSSVKSQSIDLVANKVICKKMSTALNSTVQIFFL